MKAEKDILECGTSLAEQEYTSSTNESSAPNVDVSSVRALRSLLARDVVTQHKGATLFTSPFSIPKHLNSKKKSLQVPLVYTDQTASNQVVASIEAHLQEKSIWYGNTHTTTSITGSQSTALVAEARQIVAEATHAKITGKASQDVVLFAGNGTTSAVELLIDCLGIQYAESKPVVLAGPFEHHSNLIPWREAGCTVVMIPENSKGSVDLEYLEKQLQQYPDSWKMGTFTAASNVTGQVCDTHAIAALLHRYNALAFFDYATGAPYLSESMNMNPHDSQYESSLIAKDAMFLSPHKMYGGVGTPGVLVIKKHLVSQSNPPRRSGGGTVFYVTREHHRFLSNRLERYEGGSPNVTGIWRAGLAFLAKRHIQEQYAKLTLRDSQLPATLEEYEFREHARIVSQLKAEAPNLVLLGSNEEKHVPIFSFLVRFGDRFLHYNYVCAILNDLFGIQSRGGCQCAGPYSQHLLGLTRGDQNSKIEKALLQYKERAELLRPGYTRLSLPFKGLDEEQVNYVVKALVWVSKNAWAVLCLYSCNHRTGEWRHLSRQGKALGRSERKWLSHYSLGQELISSPSSGVSMQHALDETYEMADHILKEAMADQRSISQALKMSSADAVLEELEELRWYTYPKEVAVLLSKQQIAAPISTSTSGAINPYHGQDDEVDLEMVEAVHNERGAPEESGEHIDETARYMFRDGDHSGEAPFVEIRAGVEDGELSENCELFDYGNDCWKPYDEFYVAKKAKSDLNGEVHPSPPVHSDDKSELSSAMLAPKKASRDHSTWGKGKAMDTAASQHKNNVGSRKEPESSNATTKKEKKSKFKHTRPTPKMMKLVTNALVQWEMIRDGDRLLLGLSGGKDSLSLLHCLLEFKRKLPIKFDIEVCTIDPMTASFDPSPLIPYVESLGLKYHYIRDDIVGRANSSGKDGKVVSSLCAYCARMKRGNLYACARKNNCNKLVLAQHLDDCAESCFMSLMHNGFLRTMKANYQINAGDISVIRPLVYCRESLMTEFAKTANLPVINENCPACFEEPKERARVKKLLSREETLYPNFYDNIKRALIPLMHDDLTGIMRCYTEETLARSKRDKNGKRKRTTIQGSVYDDRNDSPKETESQVNRNAMLADASEQDLLQELARRKAEKFRLSGAMKGTNESGSTRDNQACEAQPEVQVCTTSGGCTIFD